jgi:hypothetical protein
MRDSIEGILSLARLPGKPLSKIYPYRMPIHLSERKEDTFPCKGKPFRKDITPPEAFSNPSRTYSIINKNSVTPNIFNMCYNVGTSGKASCL